MAKELNRKAGVVEVKGVSKRFGKQEVLRGVNFEVKAGEIFLIMGPSGSGKSVLLKHIIGLEEPTEGEVRINGLDAGKVETHREVVTSMVFQSGALFNSMTVYENLEFYPKEHGRYGKEELRERVMETLKLLSLEDAAGKLPSELSGGMRKRVAIARSLMMEPQVLLYDEPTSELDPIMAATIAEIIATLKDKFDVTSIVVSHDPKLAMGIADRIAILMDGEIRVIASPVELGKIRDEKVEEFLNPRIDLENPRFRKFEE